MKTFLDEQRDCYDRLSERAESWKADHRKAIELWDLQDAIRIGLAILTNIRRRHESSLDAIEQKVAAFSWETAESFCEAYRWWLARSQLLLDALSSFERDGYHVYGGDDFRKAVCDVSLMSLNLDDDRISLDSLESGQGIPSKQALDDLRHRLRRTGA